ncbi:MAG: hypothetical protein H8D67_16795 [Deltaproteobacteria bacterium]|nr:hypothetical protein [Deltaproteobacteria bacterium]
MSIFGNSRMSGCVRASGAMDCRYAPASIMCSICGNIKTEKHNNKDGKRCKGTLTFSSGGGPQGLYSSKTPHNSGGGYGGSATNER